MSEYVLQRSILAITGLLVAGQPVFSQTTTMDQPVEEYRHTCPGDPPNNLAAFDCSFTKMQRLDHYVASSITDQAILGAAFAGAFAHLRKDPQEWRKDWGGYSRRVGIRYERKVLGGAAQYAVGALMGTDPRHVTYAADPLITRRRGGAGPRISHALMDWVTVRKSAADAKGKRRPNLPLFAAALANGFAGNLWQPKREATVAKSLRRSTGPLQTALLGSFYNEFSPEVGRMLATLVKRRPRKP